MADLIRHLESRFRVKPGMTQEGEAGMTKAVMLDSGSGAGMTFNTIVMADLIRHLDSGSSPE